MAKKIRCEWANKQRFVTNPDGQIWPCCYFANLDFYLKNNPTPFQGHVNQSKHPVYQAYDSDRDRYNANNHPPHEILQDEWFSKTLPESWEGTDSDRPFLCIKHCEVDDL